MVTEMTDRELQYLKERIESLRLCIKTLEEKDGVTHNVRCLGSINEYLTSMWVLESLRKGDDFKYVHSQNDTIAHGYQPVPK